MATKLTRRQFIKGAGATAALAGLAAAGYRLTGPRRSSLALAQEGQKAPEEKLVPTYCYQCNAGGPDLISVRVRDGIAVGVEPNREFKDVHPGEAGVCVKSVSLIQKHYSPYRVKGPMVRTNPKKGVNEDPGFKEISWDEALNLWAQKLKEVRQKGLVDENGYPRVAMAEGSDGVCPSYYGTLPVLFGGLSLALGAPPGIWGPTEFTMSQGGGVKCYHTEHLLGELWHKAFTCVQDTPYCNYLIAFGRNDNASGGVVGVHRTAAARARGMRRVQVEPHLSVTGATADEWIPIRPETDHTFMYAMIHVILHEMDWRQVCDIPFLKQLTNAPYLVAPNGYFLRDPASKKPLVWDARAGRAVPYDAPNFMDFALEGEYTASGITLGPDGQVETLEGVKVRPSFVLLVEHVKDFTPEWAAEKCDVPAATIRRITHEFVRHAQVGATTVFDGVTMPLRPVAIVLGKTVNNGWGGMQCVWAAHVLEMLVGALEVPGGDHGNRVLYSGPMRKNLDGFFEYPFNPTDKEHYKFPPGRRDGTPSICPLTGPFLGPLHLAWKWINDPPPNWPKPSVPEVFITYKVNPVISQFDTPNVIEVLSKIPFHVAFVYTLDETAWFADLLLPEDGDLESLQVFPVGGTTFFENFWRHAGLAIKQPVVKRQHNTMNITDIATELADRLGMLAQYNMAINHGAYLGLALAGTPYELRPDKKYTAEEIYDAITRAATHAMSQGRATVGLDYLKQHGAFFGPFPTLGPGITMGGAYMRPWYLYPYMVANGIRFELPYQERLLRIGEELRARLAERNITWWDKQAKEYQALPHWEDITAHVDEVTRNVYGKNPQDYPFWVVNTRSMQYAWGSNIDVPWLHEAAQEILGHTWVAVNAETARQLGLKDGDEVWIESPYAKTKGRIKTRQGIRPDTVLFTQMYGQWMAPYGRRLRLPNINQIAPALIELTDESGGSKDHARVKIYKA